MSFCDIHGTDDGCSECVAEYYDEKIKNLERQLAERNQSHLELHQDYNSKYNECEELKIQLEEQDVLLKAYSEALRTHPNPNQVQTVIDTALSGYKKLLPQHSQYRKLKEKGDE